jgi:5,5'-dehydrodivanillate O-demethylase
MLSAEKQEILTRVGPGTPMGELLRRYWYPIAAESELAAGRVRRVRLLGEDLALFRDVHGRLGLLDTRCPHRGAALGYGWVDDAGVRCPYHGWQFGADGSCLDIPTEADAAAPRARVRARAYRAESLGGLIFGYLGPEPAPLLPRYDLYVWEGVLRDIGHALIPCNWLQIMENSVDPLHVEWLHGHYASRIAGEAGRPEPTPYRLRQIRIGFDRFDYGVIKRRVVEGGSQDDDDWRIGHPLVFPVTLRVGARGQYGFQIRVPVDDTHTWHVWYSCFRPPEGGVMPVQDAIPFYEVPWRGADGDFRLDFIDGQDIMAWVTQGAIADRTREQLVGADRGLALLRGLLLEQLDRVRQGQDPLGVIRDPEQNRIIELPQEEDKYGDTPAFRAAALRHGHVQFSPIRDRIFGLFGIDANVA